MNKDLNSINLCNLKQNHVQEMKQVGQNKKTANWYKHDKHVQYCKFLILREYLIPREYKSANVEHLSLFLIILSSKKIMARF